MKNKKTSSLLAFLFMLPVFISFQGCGMWTNFTTYYNLYYNASTLFEDAELLIKEQKKDILKFQSERLNSNAQANITKVIEKLSRILQFNSKSKYVDDALLILGKSFYYQQDYLKAIRKCSELMATFPESELVPEAKLWIAKSNYKLRNFSEAETMIAQLKDEAKQSRNNSILEECCIERASYLLYTENYSQAIEEVQTFIQISNDDEAKAKLVYEIGKMYQKLNDFEKAGKAFEDVQLYSPSFQVDYDSRLQKGVTLRELKNTGEALSIFKSLKNQSKYNEFLDQTRLQIGITLYELKRPGDAFNELTEVDTTYKQSRYAGIAEYMLGQIMEQTEGNLDSANVYYKKAMAGIAPEEYVLKSKKKVATYQSYKENLTLVSRYSKQLNYALDSLSFIKDSIDYVNKKFVLDSLRKEGLKRKEIDESFKTKPSTADRTVKTENNSVAGVQPERSPVARPGTEPGQDASESRGLQPDIAASDNSYKYEKLVEPQRSKLSADSLKVLLVKSKYDLAALFFTEMNMPDSAYVIYKEIIEKNASAVYQPRAYFALGTYYLTLNKKDKADSLFNLVYANYKGDPIVNAAADKLGKPLIVVGYDPAEKIFHNAEKSLTDNEFVSALGHLKLIYSKYPKSTFAPKAWYTSGWIMENKLKKYDSAAVFYDSTLLRYPKSKHAMAVRGKMAVYHNEIRRIKMHADSLKISDSLKLVKKTTVTEPASKEGMPDAVKQKENLQQTPKPEALQPDNKKILPVVPVLKDSLKNMLPIDKVPINKAVQDTVRKEIKKNSRLRREE